MLTATYTLVALSVEQASVRISLLSLQQYAHANLRRQHSVTLAQLQYACEALDRLYQTCHWRKIEMYLIPALRQATQQADRLLDELSNLNHAALDILKALQRTREADDRSEQQVAQICSHIDSFCAVLLKRLEKEEGELFAIARSAICGDAWFNIANKFLLHDANVVESRRRKASVIQLPPRAEAKRTPIAAPGADADADVDGEAQVLATGAAPAQAWERRAVGAE
jgi:hemerythrin-like domain-containing protein